MMVRLLTDGGFFTILTSVPFKYSAFLMILLCPPLVLEIRLLGGMTWRVTLRRLFILGIFVATGSRHRLCTHPSILLGQCLLPSLGRNSGVLNMSGLNDYLVGLISGNLVGRLLPCLYCYGIFANLATILPRFTNSTPEEWLRNLKLVSQKQCIEHVFGDHRVRFKLFSVPHYLCLFNQGVKV